MLQRTLFFTRLGQVVAALALVYGLASVAMGASIVTGIFPMPEPGIFSEEWTPGQAIARGVSVLLGATALGVVVEISLQLRNLVRKD